MSIYTRNQPVATDDLSVSQPILQANTNTADDFFGVDHYKFSAVSNNGFHNQVTTPSIVGGTDPTTSASIDIFYAKMATANIGILQFSRGYSVANSTPSVPTPVTSLMSPSTPIVIGNGSTTTILDFAGVSVCSAQLFAFDINTNPLIYCDLRIVSDGTVVRIVGIQNGLDKAGSGTILQIKNVTGGPLNNVYWTLNFLRVQ